MGRNMGEKVKPEKGKIIRSNMGKDREQMEKTCKIRK